jgi:hypothetical protein
MEERITKKRWRKRAVAEVSFENDEPGNSNGIK